MQDNRALPNNDRGLPSKRGFANSRGFGNERGIPGLQKLLSETAPLTLGWFAKEEAKKSATELREEKEADKAANETPMATAPPSPTAGAGSLAPVIPVVNSEEFLKLETFTTFHDDDDLVPDSVTPIKGAKFGELNKAAQDKAIADAKAKVAASEAALGTTGHAREMKIAKLKSQIAKAQEDKRPEEEVKKLEKELEDVMKMGPEESKLQKKGSVQWIKVRVNGKEYPTVAAAAKATGIKDSTLYRHVKEKSGQFMNYGGKKYKITKL